jgi:aerobic-type carbon monoxide dehydrogenase small subunit (CoxS/CutS family)
VSTRDDDDPPAKAPNDETHKVTRRRFLAGASLTAATATLAEGCKPSELPNGGLQVLGPGHETIALRVNGRERRLSVEPRATLADVLRFDLGLTGTKVVCNRGSCSACTVWLDGVPVNACTTFAFDAVGKELTTIEGLARGDDLHPVQQAFIDHDAMQCGFCTPGMVMSCAALLQKNPKPTLDDVRAATSGNLCRCGTYPKVFEATLAASRLRRRGGRDG